MSCCSRKRSALPCPPMLLDLAEPGTATIADTVRRMILGFRTSCLVYLAMLVLVGGRERSATEFDHLFTRAGFQLTRVIPTDSPLSIVEGIPT